MEKVVILLYSDKMMLTHGLATYVVQDEYYSKVLTNNGHSGPFSRDDAGDVALQISLRDTELPKYPNNNVERKNLQTAITRQPEPSQK